MWRRSLFLFPENAYFHSFCPVANSFRLRAEIDEEDNDRGSVGERQQTLLQSSEYIYIYMFMSIWFPFDKPIAERNAGRSFVIDTCTQHTHPCHAMPYVVCKRMRKCVCVLVVPSVKALVMPDRRANSGGNDGPGHGKSNKMLRQRCTLFAVIRSVVPFFYIIIACFPSSLFSLFTLARILTFHMTWQWKCSRCVRIKWN